MSTTTQDIPAALADRFAGAFDTFTASVTTAVTEAAQDPQQSLTPDFRAWKDKVLPLLQKQQARAQQALEAFRQGDPAALLSVAENKRGLAKDLDGFPLTFAGPAHAETLDTLETALVTAACHLCVAAGIP